MMKKNLAALLGIIALVAPCFGASAQEPTKMVVSYSTTADFSPAFIAKDEGIFAKHGLDVTLINLATTSLGPPALQAGSVQIASISPPLLLLANDGGLDLVAVEAVAAMNANDSTSSIVTRPGFVATAAKDFIGKRIARPGINSAIDIMLKKWFIDRNVAIDQVTFAEVPFPQMGDLLKSGQIDAAVELEPLLNARDQQRIGHQVDRLHPRSSAPASSPRSTVPAATGRPATSPPSMRSAIRSPRRWSSRMTIPTRRRRSRKNISAPSARCRSAQRP